MRIWIGRRSLHSIALRSLVVFGVLLGTWGAVPAAWAQEELFVSNFGNNTITAYPRTVNGSVPPTGVITMGLSGPHQIAINRGDGELVVVNNQNDSVTVYDYDTGDLKRTIAGALTRLSRPTGVFVDEMNQELYVANDWYGVPAFANAIMVYDLAADGNAAPLRVIQGAATTLGGPVGVAIDLDNDEVVVANYFVNGRGSLTAYPRLANGNVAPNWTIQGANTGLSLPQALAVDSINDEIVVANSAYDTPNAGNILVFGRLDTGDVVPIRKIDGPAALLCNPTGLALDLVHNELFVANSGIGAGTCGQSVAVYTRTANGNAAPLRYLPGPPADLTSGMAFPVAVAVTTGQTIVMGPYKKQGKAMISNGDWVSGGYSLKSNVTGTLAVAARITITGKCSNGGTDTLTIPLQTMTYSDPADHVGWLPVSSTLNPLSWQGAVQVGVDTPAVCGGAGNLNAKKGAILTATISVSPLESDRTVKFRFKYRDPAAKGRPNVTCMSTSLVSLLSCLAPWSGPVAFEIDGP